MKDLERVKINIDIKTWKLTASSAYKLATHRDKITEKQAETIQDLSTRTKPLTDNQAETLKDLIAKRDAPDELPQGAKTYLREEYNRLRYGIYDLIDSKQMEKGRFVEQDCLDVVSTALSEVTGQPVFLPKVFKRKSDNYFMGEIDSFFRDVVIDTKAAWNKKTFDANEEQAGWMAQLNVYMRLEKKSKGVIAHCLMNTPEHLVYDEFRRESWSRGIIDDEGVEAQELEEQIRKNHTFDHLPPENRVKFYHYEYDKDFIEFMITRVKLARIYLQELWEADDNAKFDTTKEFWEVKKPKKKKLEIIKETETI